MKLEAGRRLPEWIRPHISLSGTRPTRKMLSNSGVVTVCEEARCPNRSECFGRPSAAFMILGSVCTRDCGFCAVSYGPSGLTGPDPEEPVRVAKAAIEMGLRYVVVTSVSRDDLDDGGASQFASTIRAIKALDAEIKVEVLVPDFKGEHVHLDTVLDASPDVLNHNLETVPSLYPSVRAGADYARSLALLGHSKKYRPEVWTKSGLMLGLGEDIKEVESLLQDLRTVECDFVTIGQYLRPGKSNLPVKEYIRPEVFDSLGLRALEMGFSYVSSSPLTRSSMNAEEMFSSRQEN